VLALIFQGRHNEAREELARFVLRHPNAKGALAGQDDRYAAILNRTLQTFQKESIRNNDEPWTTFGGSASRHRTLTSALSHALWEDGPAWRVPLPDLGKASRLAFHPVIVHNQVLIADHRSLVSYHLATGKIAFRYVHDDILKEIGTGVTSPRFTLSADGERAYVRLGRPGIGPGRSTPSYLVCIDLTQSGVARSGSERELWHVRANGADKAPAFFEGAPLVHGGRVYIALSRVVGRRVVTSIVCYDTQGRQRWTREVCDCPEFEDNGNGPRYRQHLLTLAGGQIVYCSHAGAIVAVDAWTGQPTWAVRYPSRGPHTAENGPSPRDLTPALYADGCVFAAPLDCDRVFCIDAVTGQIQWETEGVEVVHLLGVAQGRLIAATNQGLISIRTATGQTEWSQPSDGRLPSAGRGLLAGDWLIWPTQDAKLPYRLVTLRSGQPPSFDPSSLHTVPVGNLAFGQGCLAIAGVSELVVYVPAHKINELPPGGGRPHARLGQKYFPIFRQ
jgi:outer membrane protein assembly factor BamB